jgi:hypothetical protein
VDCSPAYRTKDGFTVLLICQSHDWIRIIKKSGPFSEKNSFRAGSVFLQTFLSQFVITSRSLSVCLLCSRRVYMDFRCFGCPLEVSSQLNLWRRKFLSYWRITHLKEPLIWRMASSGMLRRVALVRIDVSEELSASFIRVTRIGELGTTPALTSNRRTLRRNAKWGRHSS